jgi:glutathione-regulated potassium-efflux system ancillary protein KefC
MDGNILIAIFVLLGATVLLVPLAKWAGLGTILGYLIAGVLIGPYGLSLISNIETIQGVAEFGIVMMLFLIGLDVDARELWRMRHQVLGLGLTQMVLTSLMLAAAFALVGFSWPASAIIGMALAMSSTAIAMQTVAQRSLTHTDTGRASLAILLVQDVAVIPVLAAIPLLASLKGSPVEALGDTMVAVTERSFDWWVAIGLVLAFVGALVGSRYVVRPLLRWVALAKLPEAFTAFALMLVVGAALGTMSLGLSPALGAFLGGVLLADSEYRHELQGNLEPLKGLLLGLFFVSVGMSIAFGTVLEQPLLVLGIVASVIALKVLVLFGLASVFRMHVADRLLLAVLLSQAGEFAFVVLQFARTAGGLSNPELELITAAVALSMAVTPLLLLAFDRLIAPRFSTRTPLSLTSADDLRAARKNARVIVLGYGRFGQIVTRLLRAQGYEMTLIDDDAAQIELVKRFGVKVFYGDGGRLDILRAAGADEARMIVIAVAGGDRILSIATLIRRHYPHVIIAARAVDRSHAHDLMALGVEVFERETFHSAIVLGEKALIALGHAPETATRLAAAFLRHDETMLRDSFAVRGDQSAYIGLVRRSTEMLDAVMRADRETALQPHEESPTSLDKPAKSPSE